MSRSNQLKQNGREVDILKEFAETNTRKGRIPGHQFENNLNETRK